MTTTDEACDAVQKAVLECARGLASVLPELDALAGWLVHEHGEDYFHPVIGNTGDFLGQAAYCRELCENWDQVINNLVDAAKREAAMSPLERLATCAEEN